jgi:hypothetical protein
MLSKRVGKFRKNRKNKQTRRIKHRGGGGGGCLNPSYFIPLNPNVIEPPVSTSNIPRITGGTRRKRRQRRRGGCGCGGKQSGGYFGADWFSVYNYNTGLSNAITNGESLASVPSPYPFN